MLGANGYLPPGRRLVTVEELHAEFVAPFPESKNRQALFDSWFKHRDELCSVVDLRCQWIGGSFVSDKLDPPDIDVISFYGGLQYDGLSRGLRSLIDKLLDSKHSKLMYGIDSYGVAEYPEGDQRHEEYLFYRGYWDRMFGRIKRGGTDERGYLEVAL